MELKNAFAQRGPVTTGIVSNHTKYVTADASGPGNNLRIHFSLGGSYRQSHYAVTINEESVIELLNEIAEKIPGISGALASCAAIASKKDADHIKTLTTKLEQLSIGRRFQ